MQERHTGYLYCALAMASVGSTIVASKLIAAGLPPFTATALRFALAFPIFLFLLRMAGSRWPRLDFHDLALLVLQAGAGSVGYTVLLLAGMRYTSAGDAGVIAGTLPIVSAGIAVLALGEKPRPSLIGAITLATLGVLACTISPSGAALHGSMQGNLLILAAVVCEGLFILLHKRLRTVLSPLQQSTAMSGFGLVLSLTPAWWEAPWQLSFPAMSLLAVAYYALVPTVGGFLLWYAGASRLSGTEAGLFTALVPVSAMVLALLFLHEAIGPAQLAGVVCVLFAVALASWGARRGIKAPDVAKQAGVQ